jgi:hypothetical protein
VPAPRTALLLVAVAAVLGACSDDDDAPTEPTPLMPGEIDVTPTLATIPSIDPDFVPSVLADDIVTAEELTTAYERYVDCLADGGASGEYAYDLSLHAALVLDNTNAAADTSDADGAALVAGCSNDYLDGLSDRYFRANPDPDDIGERQRDSIVACVREVDPAAAADVPDVVTTDTAAPGYYLSGTLDVSFMTDDPEKIPAIERCFYGIGAEWRTFGTPDAGSSTSSSTGDDTSVRDTDPATSS